MVVFTCQKLAPGANGLLPHSRPPLVLRRVRLWEIVYWKLEIAEGDNNHILEFHMPGQEWDTIELPDDVSELYSSDIHIMPAEDGGVGFAGVNGPISIFGPG